MAGLNETPRGNRIRIAFFGLRNAGKSTLVNAFCGQPVSIVSDIAGTTTDPVSKAMEILPLGPCLVTDTAGLDDVGALGELRVQKTLDVLATADVAVWVHGEVGGEGAAETEMPMPSRPAPDVSAAPSPPTAAAVLPAVPPNVSAAPSPPTAVPSDYFSRFLAACRARRVRVLEYCRGDSVEDLKRKISALDLSDDMPELLADVVEPGDRVVCVCPIDESAPKGRLILPQVQVIRACLDRHVPCSVVQPSELRDELERVSHPSGSDIRGKIVVVTDSQAFREVKGVVDAAALTADTADRCVTPPVLTSFSILFARQKGDLDVFRRGLEAVKNLKDGDTVLVAEGCTHHRQCNDIGTTKIPKAVAKLAGGKKLNFVFTSGNAFEVAPDSVSLVVHCGGCMLTRREMLSRLAKARAADIPIVNYGILLGAAAW